MSQYIPTFRPQLKLGRTDMPAPDNLRELLLEEVHRFAKTASAISGVAKISLPGSLTTNKQNPKDADLLVQVKDEIDIESLAAAGRRIKGRGQSLASGADIFLCNMEGQYIGRTCSFRECHPRVRCFGSQCHRATYICDDLDNVTLSSELIEAPLIEIWPNVVTRCEVPEDVQRIVLVWCNE